MKMWLRIAALIVVAVLVVGLYKAKTDAADARAHVRALESDIADARAETRALRAEIAHLESPARIEDLAARNLELAPPEQTRVLTEAQLAGALPAPRASAAK